MFKTAANESLQHSVLEEAFLVVKEKGIGSIRMRELSSACGCSVGTLYNLFENLDDIHYHINLRTFKMLFGKILQKLEELSKQGIKLEEILPKLGWAYITFGKEQFHLWKALFENTPQSKPPSWYRSVINESFEQAEQYIAQTFEFSPEKASKLVNYFWFSIHGVSSIILHKRASNQSDEFLNSYVEHCLRGVYEFV